MNPRRRGSGRTGWSACRSGPACRFRRGSGGCSMASTSDGLPARDGNRPRINLRTAVRASQPVGPCGSGPPEEAPMAAGLHVAVLGPFQVTVAGDEIGPGGSLRRSLMALLALRADEVLTVD